MTTNSAGWEDAFRRLAHRWFIQYNPLYLVSAALVWVGVNLLSHAMMGAGHTYAVLGVPALAELYAFALIGGAALLLRVGLRRPAVMLALLAVLYQGDLTLHTETCAYLGVPGAIASAAWFAVFALKLAALRRAMRLRLSPSAFAVPLLAGAGLVVVPRLVQHAGPHAAGVLVTSWVFAVLAAALWMPRRVEHTPSLDAWGQTVLRRSLLATWTAWALLGALHVAFWFSARTMDARPLWLVAPLLALRFVKGERRVAGITAATLALAASAAPDCFSVVAALAACALVERAVRLAPPHAQVSARLLFGSLVLVWASVWMAGWSGGPLPQHVLALDAALAAVAIGFAWRPRVRSAFAPLVAMPLHWAVQARILTAPVTPLEWGLWAVGMGFFLLGAAIAGSVHLHLRTDREAPPQQSP